MYQGNLDGAREHLQHRRGKDDDVERVPPSEVHKYTTDIYTYPPINSYTV